jgi:hypothetical protein
MPAELVVEVLLRDEAGEGRDEAESEDHHTDHPRLRPSVSPARHEVLAPQVQHHEDEEDLDGPEVQAVDESPYARLVPPHRPEEGQQHSTRDHPDQPGDRDDAEDVDPGADKYGLAVWQQVRQRQLPLERTPDGKRPAG